MPNPRIKPIKQGLSKIYGYENVSVRNGRGTAWGWIEINVKTDYEDYHKKRIEIERQAIDILKEVGLTPYTYAVDDGYRTEDNEILVRVERKRGDK